MTGYLLLLCHLIGDYVIQSHWMASRKTHSSLACAAHALTYTMPFILVTRSVWALAFICVTHFVVDRFRVARLLVWAKNQAAPRRYRPNSPGSTGYPADVPSWLAVWLLIIADNTIHLALNLVAVEHL